MHLILSLLLAARALGVYDAAACQSLRLEMKNDCLSGGCSGLLSVATIKVSTISRVGMRDPKDCEKDCQIVAENTTSNDEVCIPPIPADKPPMSSQESSEDGQKTAQQNAIEKTNESKEALRAREANAEKANQVGQDLQDKNLKASERLLKNWNQELSSGRSKDFPAERSKWKNDQALVTEAARARVKKEDFPEKKANQAELPAIRSNLNFFSRGRQLEKSSTKDLTAIAIALAQLAQMKSAGQANVDGLSAQSGGPTYLSSARPEENKQVGEVSSALRGNSKSGSAKEEAAATAEAKAEDASEATSAADTEARRSSLRARLRELLRKKLGADSTQDIPEHFLGELGLLPGSDLGEESADQLSLSEEEEEIFRLAGAETDAEVSRLRAELQEELARTEGVLPSDSLSLFERIKAVHDACAAKKCVIPVDLAVAFRWR